MWDGATRLFHWLLVASIAGAWWTAEEGLLEWHFRLGFLIVCLLVFRIVWGLIGSSTARFSSFVRGPRHILLYLRGKVPHGIGHNPLGALSVLGLLGLTSVIVVLGLVATDDDGISPGPLSHLVSYDFAEDAQDWHEDLFNVLLVLIALHVAAILYYALFKRDNLVGPMITGRRLAPEGTTPMQPAAWWRLVLAIAIAIGVAWAIWSA